MDLWVITLLLLGSAAGAGTIYVLLRKAGAQLEAMKALAAKQGWHMVHTPASFGTGANTTFTHDAANWTMRYSIIGGKGQSMTKQIIWHSPTHRLTAGAAVLGPPFRQNLDARLPNVVMRLLKTLQLRSAENLGGLASDIKPVLNDQHGPVLATPGQEHALDGLRTDKALTDARPKHADLVILRDTTGLTLRETVSLTSMDQLTNLAALGCKLRDAL